ncbi:RNA polymerase II subunit A C-terminal domain phosphatase SSU72 [Hordeum vulgare]|nr:RNA polymerase II subunit A C-terminal domain phosphatase SSU72 [Hordeum vulgare]
MGMGRVYLETDALLLKEALDEDGTDLSCIGMVVDQLKEFIRCNFIECRYKRNGLLPMLKRNISVKLAPQRWQDNTGDGVFDMILTFEERVFDLVVEDMNNREQRLLKSVLIINMDVKDNHEEAAVGAKLALDLCHKVSKQHNIYSVQSYFFH